MRAAVLTLLLVGCAGPDLVPAFNGKTHEVVRGDGSKVLPDRDFAPPPIAGGTLLALHDGLTVIAADPDTGMLWRVNVNDASSLVGLPLEAGDEPGRLVEDSAGRVHVVLRRSGAIASIDVSSPDPTLISRRQVCAEPRGIAYDSTSDRVHVACSDGQLVSFPAAGGEAVSRLRLDEDLRDVSVVPGGLVVSRFHSAELLVIDFAGTVVSRAAQPEVSVTPFFGFDAGTAQGDVRTFAPGVAWRMFVTQQGTVMTYQLGQTSAIALSSGPIGGGFDAGFGGGGSAYGGNGCEPGVVQSMLLLPTAAAAIPLAGTLPVDVAVNEFEATVVSAGSNTVVSVPLAAPPPPPGPCVMSPFNRVEMMTSQPVAVTYAGSTRVVQLRDPGALTWNGNRLTFPVTGRHDDGHALFHAEAPAALACASCHPEGREDGRVWHFQPDGARRTQNVAGGILATAPFHWDGALGNLDSLMNEVLVRRMGNNPPFEQRVKLGPWLDGVPRAAAHGADATAAARGKALFESTQAGCSACHSGTLFTNNSTADVGTGGLFQVPSLVGVSARAPFMHDGCAKTLEDRFTSCGGSHHGVATSGQVADLVAYLKTL